MYKYKEGRVAYPLLLFHDQTLVQLAPTRYHIVIMAIYKLLAQRRPLFVSLFVARH